MNQVIRLLGGPVRRTILLGLVAFVVLVVVIDISRRGTSGADDDRPAARRDIPSAPATMPAVGSWVDSRVTESGDVEVQQWVRSANPVDRLQLTTADPDAFPGTVESSDVVVSAPDGSRLGVRDSVGTRSLNVKLRVPATEFYLSYVISGDTLSDETSTIEGRTVARVTAMDVIFKGEMGPTVHVVHGPGSVINAACLSLDTGPDVAPSPCGVGTEDGGWQVELRGADRHDRVLAQLEATA